MCAAEHERTKVQFQRCVQLHVFVCKKKIVGEPGNFLLMILLTVLTATPIVTYVDP